MTATYNAHEDGAFRCYTLARDGRARQYLDCAHPTPREAIAHDPLSARGTAQDGRATADVTIRPDPASRTGQHDLAGDQDTPRSRDMAAPSEASAPRRASRPAVIPDPAAVLLSRGAPLRHHTPSLPTDKEPPSDVHGQQPVLGL
jgi:hypothetical protein